ncbi:urocanate hydratase [Halanaerobium praevalens]|uniref:Urocanate hydratase n=1 Tax=Halanaerobium praevalens (strain ATCC 33744 / DSM 2228 / GSL) TaxID=572479 RepID=E3DLY7_HALPG|nr:urocanate hydratase [Halanaerobium praevalens]ADO76246.1 urocanate hydratase [Halanaerobium praevalens DSM 2228]
MKFDVAKAMKIKLAKELPAKTEFKKGIRRAPKRELNLSQEEIELALKNALRYIPNELHEKLAPEFMEELLTHGRIYGYRYRPQGEIKAKPITEYQGQTLEGKALQLMIDNNLDFEVALYPYELVTYGETGQVCQNWMQYRLLKKYLQKMTHDQTLVVQSGHPLGLFPSKPGAPRVISTNGLMVGMYDDLENFNRAAALGVANYGQMTAGGWMYIGPQGIVHGTYTTLLNAGRKFLGNDQSEDLSGQLYITSGLGGMSGAQAKAVEIAGGIGVIAEVDESRIQTRHEQGWVGEVSADLDEIFALVKQHKKSGEEISIAYHGNIVDLLEYVVENKIEVDLLSDQTSCHEPYTGGYSPVGYTFAEGRKLLNNQPAEFRKAVDQSLTKHYQLISKLVDRGAYFFDYGNSFMKAIYDAGVKEIAKNPENPSQGFIFPSYVEDVMGPICFDYGYGPFRWVCLSGEDEDLRTTDQAAMACIDPERRSQDYDNYQWISDAEENELVVGSKARILYADGPGRVKIALRFNKLIREGKLGPVMLGRDHHDVSGTDSPFRETANIKDGSNVMAEMSIHCFAGNCARGMTLAVESNGGGVGIGKAFNGGFGLVLDGSKRVDNIIKSALDWDVHSGVARRAWARNEHAIETMVDWNQRNHGTGQVTLPYQPEENLIKKTVAKSLAKYNN